MNTPTSANILIKALHIILRPLVRLLLEYGITYPQLMEQLKVLFVEVVNEEMLVEGKKQTLSRISVVSGVHRKDVKRILQQTEEDETVTRAASLSARVLGLWLGEAAYLDEQGKPRALKRLSDSQGGPSFEELVVATNKDVRPRAILDEWLRTGVVSLTENDEVVLDPDSFVTEKNFDERVHFFARNLRDHIACGVHNLLPNNESKFFERAVFYDRLTKNSVLHLQQFSSHLAMEQLQQINKEALRLADQDEGSPHANYRMTFGNYYYHRSMPEDKK